jgi:hypothetical protein
MAPCALEQEARQDPSAETRRTADTDPPRGAADTEAPFVS